MEKLKPCPFCGNAGVLDLRRNSGNTSSYWHVYCDDSQCLAYHTIHESFTDKDEAINTWNKRLGGGGRIK